MAKYIPVSSFINLPNRVWEEQPNGKWASRQWEKGEPQLHMATVWPDRKLGNLQELQIAK